MQLEINQEKSLSCVRSAVESRHGCWSRWFKSNFRICGSSGEPRVINVTGAVAAPSLTSSAWTLAPPRTIETLPNPVRPRFCCRSGPATCRHSDCSATALCGLVREWAESDACSDTHRRVQKTIVDVCARMGKCHELKLRLRAKKTPFAISREGGIG